MKTTKKGFTLIELIVVIAIIGVLAAILVPTMLGYVRKSKISSANSAASSVFKAINSALTELDEEGIDVGGDYLLTLGSNGTWSAITVDGTNTNLTSHNFSQKVQNFFGDIDKLTGGKAVISGASCVACAVATDSTYVGTSPAGVVTSDTFETYKGSAKVDDAVEAALGKAGYKNEDSKIVKSGSTAASNNNNNAGQNAGN